MQVSSVTSARESAAFTAGSATATSSSRSTNLGQNDFLKLLAKQYQTQDPMKPMEDTTFIASMAQFSALEQSSSTLSQITAMNSKQDIATANSYLGRLVTIDDGKNPTVQGEATAVQFVDGQPRLVVGGTAYAVDSVVRVAPKPVPPVPAANS